MFNGVVCTLATALAREWSVAQHQLPPPVPPKQIHVTPDPSLDVVQCFSDASWREETREAGFGRIFLARYQPSISAGSTASNIASPLMAEATALLLAIHQAIDLNLNRVSFASDSLQLIKALNQEASFKELHGIHHDILSLSASFELISFVFVPRDRNREADELAKSALLSLPTVPV